METIRLEPEADWKSGAKSLGTDDLTKSPGVVWKSVPSLCFRQTGILFARLCRSADVKASRFT